MQPIHSSSMVMLPVIVHTPAAASSSRGSLSSKAGVYIPKNPNQGALESPQEARLLNLLAMPITLESINTNPLTRYTLKSLIQTLYYGVQCAMQGGQSILEVQLKGGAVHHVLLGDDRHFSDIDIGLELNSKASLAHIKAYFRQWALSNGVQLEGLMLVQNDQSQFLIMTLPTQPKKLDIQFTISCLHSCTCSYNSLRVDISNALWTESDHPSILKTVDHYGLEDALQDVKEGYSQAAHPADIFEGFRAHCALLTKGVLPRTQQDEEGFSKGLDTQYGHNNYLALNESLLKFLPRHYSDTVSQIIYLLNYEGMVRRSQIPLKENIQHILGSLISRFLGNPGNNFQGFSQKINSKQIENVLDHCRFWLFEVFINGKTSRLIGEKKFYSLFIPGEHSRYLIMPRITRSFREGLEKAPLDASNLELFTRFKHLFVKLIPGASVSVLPLNVPSSAAGASSSSSSPPGPPKAEEKMYADKLEGLKNVSIPDYSRCQDAIHLLSHMQQLDQEQRKCFVLVIIDILSQLVEGKNYLLASELLQGAFKKFSPKRLEGWFLPPHDRLIANLWKGLTVSSPNKDHQKNIRALFILFMSASKDSSSFLNDLVDTFPQLTVIEDEKDFEDVITLLLLSCHKIEISKRSTLRKKCLDMIFTPDHFGLVKSIVWKRCQALQSKGVENPEIKKIAEQFIIAVLNYPEDISREYISQLFNTFSCMFVQGSPLFDSIFRENLTPILYLKLQHDLLELPLLRFLSFFERFIYSQIACDVVSENFQLAVEQGAMLIETHLSYAEEIPEWFSKFTIDSILIKFPVMAELAKKYLKKVDDRDFFDKLKVLIPMMNEPISQVQKSGKDYAGLGDLIGYCIRSTMALTLVSSQVDVSASEKPIHIEEVHSLFNGEIKRLVALSSVTMSSLLPQKISSLITVHIKLMLISKRPAKAVLELFKKAIRNDWLLVEDFKQTYANLFSELYDVQNGVKAFSIFCKELPLNEMQAFFCHIIAVESVLKMTVQTNKLQHVDQLECDLNELVKMRHLNPKFVADSIITPSLAFVSWLERQQDAEILTIFQRIHPLLMILVKSKTTSPIEKSVNRSLEHVVERMSVDEFLGKVSGHFEEFKAKRLQMKENGELYRAKSQVLLEDADLLQAAFKWYFQEKIYGTAIEFIQQAIEIFEELCLVEQELIRKSAPDHPIEASHLKFQGFSEKLTFCYRRLLKVCYTENMPRTYTSLLRFFKRIEKSYPHSQELYKELYPALFSVPKDNMMTRYHALYSQQPESVLQGIAHGHYDVDDYKEAIAYIEKVYALNKSIDDVVRLKFSLAFMHVNDWDRAEKEFTKASKKLCVSSDEPAVERLFVTMKHSILLMDRFFETKSAIDLNRLNHQIFLLNRTDSISPIIKRSLFVLTCQILTKLIDFLKNPTHTCLLQAKVEGLKEMNSIGLIVYPILVLKGLLIEPDQQLKVDFKQRLKSLLAGMLLLLNKVEVTPEISQEKKSLLVLYSNLDNPGESQKGASGPSVKK